MEQKLIFVLEDDNDIREIVSFILKSEGYEVEQYGTVAEFLSMTEKKVPDVYVLDISLPDGNGLDVCRQLKQNLSTSAIPVLMMSAQTLPLEITCGYNDFIAKPFDLDQFRKKVKQFA